MKKMYKVDHKNFYKSPQDYIMPGKTLIELHSKLPNNIANIIDNEFRLSYGMAVDFNNRLEVLDKIINNKLGNAVISTIDDIPRAALKICSEDFDKDFILFDFVEKLDLPNIVRGIITLFYGSTFTLKSFSDGLILSLPVLYKLCLSTGKEEFVKNLANKNYEESIRIFDMVEFEAEQIHKSNIVIQNGFQSFIELDINKVI